MILLINWGWIIVVNISVKKINLAEYILMGVEGFRIRILGYSEPADIANNWQYPIVHCFGLWNFDCLLFWNVKCILYCLFRITYCELSFRVAIIFVVLRNLEFGFWLWNSNVHKIFFFEFSVEFSEGQLLRGVKLRLLLIAVNFCLRNIDWNYLKLQNFGS